MKKKELLKRIIELEGNIADLKLRVIELELTKTSPYKPNPYIQQPWELPTKTWPNTTIAPFVNPYPYIFTY